MFVSHSHVANERRQSRHATRRETRGLTRLLIITVAILATGAFASQLVAQSESRLYYTPCGDGFVEPCGEETTYSDCGWHFKAYHMPMFPYVGVIPWYACDTETRKILYKNYFKSPNELEV